MDDSDVGRFGETPLPQTVAAADGIRQLMSMLLSLEQPTPVVDAMVAQLAGWEHDLAPALPPDPMPRMATDDGSKRLYLQRAFDVGVFNPCFPQYRFEDISADSASGRVTFSVLYEGPPGLVHGGFLGVFFDCVIQHQSCAVGRSGKTRSLNIRYRRPTPLDTELRFDIVRAEHDRGITATARLLLDESVLCIGEAETVVMAPELMSANRFARRRTD